jgi:hypothetical protein
MLDFTVGLAPHLFEAMRKERDVQARRLRWNRRLREIERAERTAPEKTVVVNRPSHLAGIHKI